VIEEAAALQPCSSCGMPTECCEFCDSLDCRAPVCYRCLRMAMGQMGQAVPQPHARGG
jgi:hypothetical protein